MEGLYSLCSENKGADQLRGNREGDLRLCFSHMQKKKFSHGAAHFNIEFFKSMESYCRMFESYIVAKPCPEVRNLFSCTTQLSMKSKLHLNRNQMPFNG